MKFSDVKKLATPVDKSSEGDKTMANEEAAQQTTDEQTEPGLSLQDLSSVIKIIDLCSQRGAFQGSELEAVGGLRGRIQAFVVANAPAEEQQTDDGATDNG